MAHIELRKVHKAFGKHPAVRDFTLSIPRGEKLVLFGPSGCGKTTVLRLIAGLIPPDSGDIRIEGKLASRDGEVLIEPYRRDVAMVFQDLALWPHMTVRENLLFALQMRNVPPTEAEERISEILSMMGMEEYAQKKPSRLSGGQQQRVALARALIVRPRILLLDEPFSSLDLETAYRIRSEILKLHEEAKFTLLLITHDRDEALQMADRVVFMSEGRIIRISGRREAEAYFEELRKRAHRGGKRSSE